MKKYELLDNDTKQIGNITLYRIKALRAFGYVKVGDVGGYIQQEDNLSHDGNAWVYGNALVYGNAWVSGDARVHGDALVYGDARVYGNAWVSGDARVYGDARVSGDARVYGDVKISNKSECMSITNLEFYLTITPTHIFYYKDYTSLDDINDERVKLLVLASGIFNATTKERSKNNIPYNERWGKCE